MTIATNDPEITTLAQLWDETDPDSLRVKAETELAANKAAALKPEELIPVSLRTEPDASSNPPKA